MNPLDALKRADEALKKQVEEKQRLKNERDRQYIMDAVAQSLPGMMSPLLERVSENSRIASDEILSALHGIKIEQPKVDVKVETPKAEVTVTNEPIKVPEIDTRGIESAIERGIAKAKFPKPEVTVNAPVVNVEAPEMPEPFDGEVTLKGVDRKRPLPVMMYGADGNPFQMAQSAGGGRGDFYTIKDIQNSTGGSLIDNDGFLRVTGAFSVSASGSSTVSLVNSDGTYYNSDNPLPVTGTFNSTPGLQVSGAVDSVNVVDAFGSTAVSGVFNADNRLRVSLETGGSGLTDSELRATSVPVSQVSGVAFSVSVNDVFGSVGANLINPDNRLKVELPAGASGLTDTELRASAVPVAQVSGASFSVSVSGAVGTIGVVTINPDGNPTYSSASSGLTDTELRASHLDVQQLSGATDSVNVVSTVGLTDTQLRASTLDIKQVSGSSDSVNVLNTVTITGAVTATGGGYLTDTQLRASSVDIKQVSGSIDSVSVIGTPTVSVTDVFGSVGANVINPDGRIKVELPSGASGLTDTELRASHLDVQQLSGAIDSVYVTGIANSSFSELQNGDGRLRVSVETGGSGLTDSELRATSVPVEQVSGSIWSTNVLTMPAVVVTSITNTIATNIVDSSGVAYSGSNPFVISGSVTATGGGYLTDTQLRASALDVKQVSGSVDSVIVNSGTITAVTSITNTVVTRLDSPDGVYSGSNPLPVTLATKLDYTNDTISTLQLSGAIDSVYITGASGTIATNIVDSTGIAYSGSNPVPIAIISDAAASTIAVGATLHGVADIGSAPNKVGGIVMTANPTAESGGDVTNFRADDIGRQINRPIQVRDLIRTAYASLSTNTETTLLTATSGAFLDLVWVKFSNTSSGAVTVDLRDSTAGSIVDTYEIPANGVVGISMAVPYPQGNQGNAWTVDYNDADVSNTTVYVSGLFSQEV